MLTLVFLALLLLPFLMIGGSLALFWKRKRRIILRWSVIGYAVIVPLALFGAAPYFIAWAVVNAGTRPPDRQLQQTPSDFGLNYEDVAFEARDALRLSGWFIPPEGKRTIIICTHGLFRNRIEVLPRMAPLVQAGYGALLYDSRSHGSSDKGRVSLGFNERNDVLGAVQYIHRRYQDSQEQPRIVLFGVSMGAVAVVEAAAESKGYCAIILDSPFATLRQTVIDHSWLWLKMPRYPFPSLFLFWLGHFAGFDPDRVDLNQSMRRLEPVPLLVITSLGDERIPSAVAQGLYNASKSPLKKVRIFGSDVTHAASARLHPQEYSKALGEFLSQAVEEPTGAKPF